MKWYTHLRLYFLRSVPQNSSKSAFVTLCTIDANCYCSAIASTIFWWNLRLLPHSNPSPDPTVLHILQRRYIKQIYTPTVFYAVRLRHTLLAYSSPGRKLKSNQLMLSISPPGRRRKLTSNSQLHYAHLLTDG